MRNAVGQFAGEKYIKIGNTFYRSECKDCGVPLKGIYAKQCSRCFWKGKHKNQVVNGKVIPHYSKAHYWIAKHYGRPMFCENCEFASDNSRQFHWANKSDEYKLERSDWRRLCASCHKFYDLEKKK